MLDNYWPKADAVDACIKNEAETADVAVLLAVHQPTPLVQRAEGTGAVTVATEQDLLDAFLTDHVPGGALLVPITGASGAGKSHIIRWLDAQLKRSAKSDQFHIIRIPKSASLRTVVELILEPLKGDPRYAKSQRDLTRAVAEVDINEAVVTFRAHLENALNACREQMVAELKEHQDRTHLKELIGHAGDLPLLFSDAALGQHFIDNVLSRVVSQALKGRSDDAEEDDTPAQFVAEDLVLPTSVDISKAAQRVRNYYQRNIAMAKADQLQPVVDLLNDAVDPAIRNVFQLEQSTGGITLQDIILAVREILFEDGKDLVLLVEDFKALAGIQEVLLKVCIYEGEYDGKKVRATMRTALALTDGYLSFRDTILTRARREWIVGGRQQSDAEIKEGVVEMVGAYLNAARWGRSELDRLFKQRGREESLSDWLPAWRDEALSEAESEAIEAFGYNSKGDALFPFNREAIKLLADRHLIKGTKLEFNPRRVINEILRNTLLMRDSFEAHSFPTPEFQEFTPNANLASWIKQAHQPEAVARRLSSLFALWGGNPTDTAAIAHIPPAIFATFSLPTPAEIANVVFVAPTEHPKLAVVADQAEAIGGIGTPQKTEQASPEYPRLADFRSKLEKWSKGTPLDQKDANELRKALMEMVKDAIDWPALRMRSIDLPPNWIKIPGTRGNLPTRVNITVCEDIKDEGGSIRAGLLGAIRYSVINNRSWSYPEADVDYVASAEVVDRLLAQLKPELIREAKAQASIIGQALITQARIIGLEPVVRPRGVENVLWALFAKPEPKETQAFEENWDRVREYASGPIGNAPSREVLQSELLRRTASFQGTGSTPFAIDIVRLLDTVGTDATDQSGGDLLSDEVKGFIRTISEGRLWRKLTEVMAKLKVFSDQIGDYIDDSFDKTAFIADLQEVVRLLGATGTHVNLPMSLREFEQRLIEFQVSPIKDLVGKVATILDADREQIAKVLNTFGSLDLGLIDRTMQFLQHASNLVTIAEANVVREEANRGQADPDRLVAEISAMLTIVAGGPACTEGSR